MEDFSLKFVSKSLANESERQATFLISLRGWAIYRWIRYQSREARRAV